MRRWLREPLLHFLVLGALLFVAYGWIHRGTGSAGEIVVARAQVESLREQFTRSWQREPTQAELQGLIDGWVRDEALYREGRALGFDIGDPVIRRRVAQKVEFLADELTPTTPTDAELQAWLEQHADNYRIDARYSFEQLYFDPSRRRERLDADLESALRALARGNPVKGDGTMLPSVMTDVPAYEVVRTFGTAFAAALSGLRVGQWSHPVESGYGVHLVRPTARTEGRAATLDEVREAVERDLLHDRTEQGRKRFYAALLDRYEVRVEGDDGKLRVAAPIEPASAEVPASGETGSGQ
jgi:PPIC-type PPIASE domain